MPRTSAERVFDHPVERVFARYCDHVGWSEWAGVGPVRLTREGDSRGVGAVRAFDRAPGLLEEVTAIDGPNRMEYRIARGGFPVTDHHGTVTFTPEGTSRTRVHWEVTFRSHIPLTGAVIARTLGVLFAVVLRALARDLDRTEARRRV